MGGERGGRAQGLELCGKPCVTTECGLLSDGNVVVLQPT